MWVYTLCFCTDGDMLNKSKLLECTEVASHVDNKYYAWQNRTPTLYSTHIQKELTGAILSLLLTCRWSQNILEAPKAMFLSSSSKSFGSPSKMSPQGLISLKLSPSSSKGSPISLWTRKVSEISPLKVRLLHEGQKGARMPARSWSMSEKVKAAFLPKRRLSCSMKSSASLWWSSSVGGARGTSPSIKKMAMDI